MKVQNLLSICEEDEDTSEIESLLAQDNPRYEELYNKIVTWIERKPMAKKAMYYKELLHATIAIASTNSLINRKLTIGAREFWKKLVSGKLNQ